MRCSRGPNWPRRSLNSCTRRGSAGGAFTACTVCCGRGRRHPPRPPGPRRNQCSTPRARPLPCGAALNQMLAALGGLRAVDVARSHTRPPRARAFPADAPERQRAWQDLQRVLEQAAADAQQALHQALQNPAVGQLLLAWVQWLAGIDAASPPPDAPAAWPPKPTRRWLRRRIRRLAERLDAALDQ